MIGLLVNSSMPAEEVSSVDTRELYRALREPAVQRVRDEEPRVRIRFNHLMEGILCDRANGGLAVAFRNGQVSVHSLYTGAETTRIQAHTGGVKLASFSDNGRVLATTADRDTARFFDVTTGAELFAAYPAEHAFPILYRSRYLVLAGSEISIVDLQTGRMQFEHLGYGGVYVGGAVDETSDTLYLVADRTVHTFSIERLESGLSFTRGDRFKLAAYGKRFLWLRLHDSGRGLLVASSSGTLVNINVPSKEISPFATGLMNIINSFDATPAGQFVFSGKTQNPDQPLPPGAAISGRDSVFRGSTKLGVARRFDLLSSYRAYACFRNPKTADVIVGTATNVANTPVNRQLEK